MNKIEGGPECERCGGTGDSWEWIEDSRSYLLTSGGCPVCEGTGVKLLSEWTDAQKAEWLKENNPTEGILTISPSGVGWSVSFIGYDANEYPIPAPNGDDAWGEDKDFSAALTAAVECVAKERDA